MTPEEREHMASLVQQIQDEKDGEKFMSLVRELNALLARKEHRLQRKEEAK